MRPDVSQNHSSLLRWTKTWERKAIRRRLINRSVSFAPHFASYTRISERCSLRCGIATKSLPHSGTKGRFGYRRRRVAGNPLVVIGILLLQSIDESLATDHVDPASLRVIEEVVGVVNNFGRRYCLSGFGVIHQCPEHSRKRGPGFLQLKRFRVGIDDDLPRFFPLESRIPSAPGSSRRPLSAFSPPYPTITRLPRTS